MMPRLDLEYLKEAGAADRLDEWREAAAEALTPGADGG
jgi:hypothetical protein